MKFYVYFQHTESKRKHETAPLRHSPRKKYKSNTVISTKPKDPKDMVSIFYQRYKVFYGNITFSITVFTIFVTVHSVKS